jgi:hypothetical protein
MPLIHLINSIKILLYSNDHAPPHFHATYNEYSILIVIETLDIYAGSLPKKQLKKVLDWAAANQTFLQEKWDELQNN